MYLAGMQPVHYAEPMVSRPRRKNVSRWYAVVLRLAAIQGDLDQVQIAERIGVTKGTVTGWKQGTPPKPDTVIATAQAYGVDPVQLLAVAYLPDTAWDESKGAGLFDPWLDGGALGGKDREQRRQGSG
jgi:transcriptional regulator with XRE-family HTH domain